MIPLTSFKYFLSHLYFVMGNLHNRLTFNLGKKNEIFYYSYILRLLELQSLATKCCYCLAKFPDFVYICITRAQKKLPFSRQFQLKNSNFPAKMYTKYANFAGLHSAFYNITSPNFAVLLISG